MQHIPRTTSTPVFSKTEISTLKHYFKIYKKYYVKVNEKLISILADHKLWGPVIKAQTISERRKQYEDRYELIRAAIYEAKWEEYNADLKMQGTIYAKLNITYFDWYEIIKIYKDILVPYFIRDYRNSIEDIIPFMDGLSKFSDYALHIIAESFFEEKNNIIEKREERFKALVQESSDHIAIIGANGKYEYVSPSSEVIFGITPNNLIGQVALRLIHEEDQAVYIAAYKKVADQKKIKLEPVRFQTNNKGWKWVEITMTNAIDDPAINGIITNSRDITFEKKLKELHCEVSDLAKIGSWEVDLLNQNIYWSEEVHKIHETNSKTYTPTLEEGINFYREDFRHMAETYVNKAITSGTQFDFEAVLLTINKNERWVRTIGNAEFVEGKCVRIYGSLQDINHTKETENRLISLSKNLPGVIYQYLIYPDGTDSLRNVTGEVEPLWGFTADEVTENVNILWNQIRDSGSYEELKKSIAKSIKSKTKWKHRFKYQKPTGEHRTHLGYGTPNFLSDGTILYNAIVLDVTQEAKNEELLEQISEMASIGGWELDFINDACESFYWSPIVWKILEVDDNYNPTLTGGFEFYEDKSKEKITNAIYTLINEGIEFDEELLLHTVKGKELWIRAIGKGDISNNKCTKVYGSFQDITVHKNMEIQLSKLNNSLQKYTEELEKSNEELGHFAYVASHDLQEPLRMITSFMDLLKRKYGDLLDDKGQQYIFYATDGAKRMKQIILDLLEYSKAGRLEEIKEQVDINELISEYKLLRRNLISEKSATITNNTLPKLSTYKALITQIFHSLLDNALKYSRETISPIIHINVTEHEKEWKFSISDNGIGIDPQFHDKIFIIFQRLHNKSEYEGTGIGLSITKKQVESMGGRISLKSSIGNGTTFYFTIPKK